jgi:hypothetical protein
MAPEYGLKFQVEDVEVGRSRCRAYLLGFLAVQGVWQCQSERVCVCEARFLLVYSCAGKALATFSGIILPRDGKEEQFPMHWAADHGRWMGKEIAEHTESVLSHSFAVICIKSSVPFALGELSPFCQPRRDIMEFLLRYPAGEDLLLQRDSQGRIPLFYAERAGNEA